MVRLPRPLALLALPLVGVLAAVLVLLAVPPTAKMDEGPDGLSAAVLLGAGHDGELEYGALAAAGRAGDRLDPVADNLLKGMAAIFANVFVDRHKTASATEARRETS